MSKYKCIKNRGDIFLSNSFDDQIKILQIIAISLAIASSLLFTFKNLELQITRNNSLFIGPYLKSMTSTRGKLGVSPPF